MLNCCMSLQVRYRLRAERQVGSRILYSPFSVYELLNEYNEPLWPSKENSKIPPPIRKWCHTGPIRQGHWYGHLVNLFSSTFRVNSVTNRLLNNWQVRHGCASLCQSRLPAIPCWEDILSKLGPSLEDVADRRMGSLLTCRQCFELSAPI